MHVNRLFFVNSCKSSRRLEVWKVRLLLLGSLAMAQAVLAEHLTCKYDYPNEEAGIKVRIGQVEAAADGELDENHESQRECCIDAGSERGAAAGFHGQFQRVCLHTNDDNPSL